MGKCCYKLSLIRREYLLCALNGLTNSPKIFHSTQKNFLNVSSFHRDPGSNKYSKGVVVQVLKVFTPAYYVACRRDVSNGTFYTFN